MNVEYRGGIVVVLSSGSNKNNSLKINTKDKCFFNLISYEN